VKTTGIFGGRFTREVEFAVEHLLVEKKQSTQCLVLSRGRDVFLDREVGEELGDLLFAHFVGMAFAVEKNIAANPIGVGLLGADAVVLQAQMPPDAIEQFGRAGGK
jgi:hypothetical protein